MAELFGLKKVGWVFAQSNKARDYIVSAEELAQMAAVQVGGGAPGWVGGGVFAQSIKVRGRGAGSDSGGAGGPYSHPHPPHTQIL